MWAPLPAWGHFASVWPFYIWDKALLTVHCAFNTNWHRQLSVAVTDHVSHWLREGGGGGKWGIRPGGTVQGAAFGGAKIYNSEIWPLLAN